jgi:tyrosine-protein kinase Etk/Wzc
MSDHIQEHNELDINLLDLLILLGQEKWTVIVITFVAALTGIVVSLITPATYVSRTTIMPSNQSSGGGGGLAGLSNLAGIPGFGALSNIASGIKSSDEMFIALLRSHSVQLALIEQFKLKERYKARNTEEARQALSSNLTILADKKSGLIMIDVQDKDPEFAAQLANVLVKELNSILSRLAVTEAQQRRAYYEEQIVKAQSKIPQLEADFKEAQKNSGLEVASLLSEVGTLPGQIAAKELQLQVLRRFATSENPELKRLTVEISALRAQMARYALSNTESKNSESNKLGQLVEGTKTSFVQKATQAYNTIKIQETLLDGYVKQLELAKVDEAKEGPTIQVVDEARAPEMRAKPERRKLVITYTVAGLIIALVLAALRALLRHIQSSPDGLQRWSQLKRAWGFV